MQLSGLAASVSSEMLIDHRVGSPVSGGSSFVGLSGPEGPELLYQAQDGSLHNLHNARPEDGGWTTSALPALRGASGLTIGETGGEPVAVCIGVNQAAPSMWTSARSGTTWSPWAERHVPPNAAANYVVRIAPDLTAAQPSVYLFMRGTSSNLAPGALTLWRVTWSTNTWTSLGPVASTLGAPVSLGGEQGFVAFCDAQTPNHWDLTLFAAQGTTGTSIAKTLAYRQLAAARNSEGHSTVFLYDPGLMTGTPRLGVVDDAKAGVVSVVDTGVPLQSLVPVDAGAGPEALYALGRNGVVVAFHPSKATASGWTSTPLPLGVHLTDVVGVLGPDGTPSLFGMNAGHQLVQLTQGSGMWEQLPVDLPAQSMFSLDSYATHLSVTDAAGRPRLRETLDLYADEVVVAEVNHQHVVLGPNTATQVTTDSSGRLTVMSPTDSLQCADLRLVSGSGASATTTHAARAGTTLKRLKNTTQAQLGTILPASMQPHAAVIQEALQRTAALAPAPSPGQPHHLAPIDSAALADMNWVFSVEGDQVSFTPKSADEIAGIMDGYRAGGASFGESQGWLSEAWDWLSDTLEAVAEEAVQAVKLTVQAAENAANIVLDCVIDGVQYVFTAVVKVVRDVLAFAEGIFNAVKTAFSTLLGFYGWLLDGARQDIWYTSEAFAWLARMLAGKVDGWMSAIIKQAPIEVNSALGAADKAIDQLIVKYGNNPIHPDAARLGRQLAPREGSLEDAASEVKSAAMWLMHRFSGPGIDYDPPWDALETVANAFIDTFKSVTSDVWQAVLEHVHNIGDLLVQTANDPAAIGALTIEFVLKEVKTLLHLVGHVLSDLVVGITTMLQAVVEWVGGGVLDKPITGFFIPEFYNLVNPGDDEAPTPVTLGALLAAFPLTIIYRRLKGVSPFGADWEQTVAPISDLLDHLGPHGSAENAPTTSCKRVGEILGGLWAIGYGFVWLPAEVYNDITPSPVTKTLGVGRVMMVVAVEGILYVVGAVAAAIGFSEALTGTIDFNTDVALLVGWAIPIIADFLIGLANVFGTGAAIPDDLIACFMGLLLFEVSVVSLGAEVLEGDSSWASAVMHLVSPWALILKPIKRLPLIYGIPVGEVLLVIADMVVDWASAGAGAVLADAA